MTPTMGVLLKQKKDLIKKRESHPEFDQVIRDQLSQIEAKIESKVNRSDQNFFRTFYRMAKEHAPDDVFNRIEGLASTRTHQYRSQNQESH